MHGRHKSVTTGRGAIACLAAFLAIPAITFAQELPDANQATRVTAEENDSADEITVTARKREESLQDVPISISVFNDKALRDRNINSAYNLSAFTPNFSFSPNLGRRLDVPNIRGQFGPLIGSTSPNASFFVDGVYVSGSIATTSLANLEQVEILRGPQSAQFGRATFSGAVNYITRKPTDKLMSEVNAKIGEDGTYELGAWASGPLPINVPALEDKLFFFAGADWQEWDGEWRNNLKPGQVDSAALDPFNGPFVWRNNVQKAGDPPCSDASRSPLFDPSGPAGCAPTAGDNSKVGGEETKVGTLRLDYRPTDYLEFKLKYERGDAADDHYSYLFVPPNEINNCYHRDPDGNNKDPDRIAGTRSGGFICGPLTNEGFTNQINIPNFQRGVVTRPPSAPGRNVATGNLPTLTGEPIPTPKLAPFLGLRAETRRLLFESNADFGEYTLTARYAHSFADSEYVRDLDRSYALGPVTTGLFEGYRNEKNNDDSIEVRLASPVDQRFRWQFGYYLYDFDQDLHQRDTNGFARFVITNVGKQFTNNNAFFGSFDLDIRDDWTLAFEGRYAEDEIVRISAPFEDEDPTSPTFGDNINIVAEDTWYAFSPRITISHQVSDDLTTYAQWAVGDKPGGFNFPYFDFDVGPDAFFNADGSPNTRPFIEAEEAKTYEIGAKGTFFDGRLTANTAFFYIDWKNQAVNVLDCIPVKPTLNEDGEVIAQLPCEDQNVVVNVGKSEIWGAELELNWFVTEALSLTAAYGFTDSEITGGYVDDELAELRCRERCYETFTDDEGNVLRTDEAQAIFDDRGNVIGNKAPYVPKHNLALSALYQAQLNSKLNWFMRNDWLYESKKYSTVSNLNWAPALWVWNGRAGVESDTFTIALYVDNITNEKSPIQIQDFPLFDASAGYNIGGGVIFQRAFSIAPRRTRNFGMTANFRF